MKKLRLEKGLKQTEIAELMGEPGSNVSFWENKSSLDTDTIERFCEALKLPLWQFFAPDDLQPLDLSAQEAYVIKMYRALPLDLQGKFVEINERISNLLADVAERASHRK